MKSQYEEMLKGCDVMIASPGRLQDFARRGRIAFNRVRFVVLDEADRMLSMSQDTVRYTISGSFLLVP